MNVLFVAVHTENRQVRIKKYTIETKYIYCNFCVWNNWVKSCCDWFKNGWCSQILCWLKKKTEEYFVFTFLLPKLLFTSVRVLFAMCHCSLYSFPFILLVFFHDFLLCTVMFQHHQEQVSIPANPSIPAENPFPCVTAFYPPQIVCRFSKVKRKKGVKYCERVLWSASVCTVPYDRVEYKISKELAKDSLT